MFRLAFGAVIGGLIMWFFGNRTHEFALDNMVGARAVDQPSSADTPVHARDRAKEQVHSDIRRRARSTHRPRHAESAV
jgi:hypothetical protein